MNTEDLIALNEEIAGMARAGLPLDQGLAMMAREMGRGRLKQVTAELAKDLQLGQTLSEALERQGGQVPPFYAGLVAAGIRTGRVNEVLATLTMYARAVANVRSIIADALFYPIVVLLFAGAMFTSFCFYILPQFDRVFEEYQMSLPAVTQFVLAISRKPLQYFVFPIAVLVITVLLLRLTMRATEAGRYQWAQFVYAIPLVGTLIRSARLAAFTDLLAILVDYEIPLPESFRLAGEASSDPIMSAAAKQVHHDLSLGLPLGTALHGRGLVPEWVSWMTGLGEQRGTLGKTLHLIADMYRRQVEMRSAILRSALPPLLIVLTAGLFTAIFVFAMMLPLVKLMEGLSK